MMYSRGVIVFVALCFLFTVRVFPQETSWRELESQAQNLEKQNKYADAGILYQRALGIVERDYGPASPVAVYILYRLAYAYSSDARIHSSSDRERFVKMTAKALAYVERAVAILEEIEEKVNSVGGDEWEEYIVSLGGHIRTSYLVSLSNLAREYKRTGKIAEAEEFFMRAAEIAGEDDWLSKHRLIEVYLQQKKYDEAEPLSKKCLEIAEEKWGPDSSEVARSLEQLIAVYLNQRKFPEAGPLLRRYAEIREKRQRTNGKFVFLETIILSTTGQRIQGKIIEIVDNYLKIEIPGAHTPMTYLLEDIATLEIAKARRIDPDGPVVFTGAPAIPSKAIRSTDIAEVEEAIRNGADVNARYRFGSTALMLAAMSRHEDSADLVKLLVENGADVNARSYDGMTALRYALQGTTETFKLLIEHGADLNVKNRRGETILMESCRGFIEKAELLMEAGADVDLQDKKGKTALMYSAENGHFHLAKLLVVNGADVSLRDNDGMTALRYAQDNDRVNIVDLLSAGGEKYIASLKTIDKDAKIRFEKAQKLLEKGEKRQALTKLKETIEVSPIFLPAYHVIGSEFVFDFLLRTPYGDATELLEIFEKATQVNPEDPESYVYLAFLYKRQFRLFDAKNAYEKAKYLYDKGAISTHLHLSSVVDHSLERVRNNISEMEEEIGRGKISAMSEEEKLEVVRYCIQKAEDAGMEGLDHYIYAINIAPDNPETAMAYLGMGNVMLMHGAVPEMPIFCYQKAIELNPELAEAYYGLAIIYSILVRVNGDQKKLDSLKRTYEKAETLFKEQGDLEMLERMREKLSPILEL